MSPAAAARRAILVAMAQPVTTTGGGTREIRVLLASADPALRAWGHARLPAGVVLCGLAGDASVVVELAGVRRADVCLVDLRLPGGGLAALAALRQDAPGVRTLAWAPADDDPELVEAVRAGVAGCVAGEPGPDALARALADVIAGGRSLPRAVVARLVAGLREPPRATGQR